MPYRRLPNTDQARIRSLQAAIEQSERTDIQQLAVTAKTKNEAETFLPTFISAHHEYLQSLEKQVAAGKKYQSQVKMARLYLSHFIQVLNFAVIRNEIKPELKRLYGLETDTSTVPDLSSEQALLNWGERVISGEQERIRMGGVPIYNPTIAKVRVHFDIFKDAGIAQKTFQRSTNRTLENVAVLRTMADGIILELWNQVEDYYKDLPEAERREKCETYGVRYYYRKNESQEEHD
jgi:hypothetical protein